MTVDRNDAANAAIREAIEELRPGVVKGSWMLLKPHYPPLSFDSDQSCMGFIGLVVERYNKRVVPAETAKAEAFAGLCGKTLITLRDAIVAKTTP